MRRTALVALLVLAAAVGLEAQAGWMDVTSQPGRLTVSMPCTGMWQTAVTQGTGPGFPFTSQLLLCRAGDEVYIVGWVDYPSDFKPNTDSELQANQDNFIKGVTGAVLSTSTSITHGGLPALEFTGKLNAQLISGRAIMDGSRPYMVVTLTPLAQDRAATIRKFLTSFRLTSR
jgi:hypothetical protein